MLKWSRFNIEVDFATDGGPDQIAVFNCLTRNLVRLDRDALQHAKETANGEESDQTILRLHDVGILVDEALDETAYMRHTLNRWKFSGDRSVVFVSFTSVCNLRCTYCYQDARPDGGQHLTLDRWNSLFRYLKSRIRSHNISVMGIVLFGGEPLVNLEVVRKAIRDLKALESVEVPISLISNGTLLSPDVLAELAEDLDMVQITLDGPEETHNQRRKYPDGRGSYHEVMDALERTAKLLPGKVVLRVNLTEATAATLPMLLQELERKGVKDLLDCIDLAAEYSPQMEIQTLGCESRIGHAMNRLVTSLLLDTAAAGWKINKSFVRGPCTFTHSNSFAVDEQLRVYKCPGFIYQEADGFIDHDSNLRITNSRWYQSAVVEPDCITHCPYAPICYGGCRWMSGGVFRLKCAKADLTANLTHLIRAYVTSRYPASKPSRMEAVT